MNVSAALGSPVLHFKYLVVKKKVTVPLHSFYNVIKISLNSTDQLDLRA
jgi:hypothetical protein